jgi:hypothetical protein
MAIDLLYSKILRSCKRLPKNLFGYRLAMSSDVYAVCAVDLTVDVFPGGQNTLPVEASVYSHVTVLTVDRGSEPRRPLDFGMLT